MRAGSVFWEAAVASHRNQDSLRAMEGQVPNHVGEKQTWSAQENAKKEEKQKDCM